MIDWNKPIETVDGRRAKVLTCVAAGKKNARSVYITPKDDFGFGDVFFVDDEGCRCDDRANYSKRQEPLIRNVPVKREGWVLVEPPINSRSLLRGMLATKHIYPSEQEAMRAKDYYGTPAGTKPVRFEWEE